MVVREGELVSGDEASCNSLCVCVCAGPIIEGGKTLDRGMQPSHVLGLEKVIQTASWRAINMG